ncbi:hypothetical protein pb186bvf_010820 [Paramecium bursaria]
MSDANTDSHSFENNPQLVVLDGKFTVIQILEQEHIHRYFAQLIASLALSKQNTNTFVIVEIQSTDQFNNYSINKKIEKKLQERNNPNIYLVKITPLLIKQDEYKHKTNSVYYYNILEKQGPSLKLCFQHSGNEFKLNVLCTIAIQAINLLETMHKASVIHCNLKPKKFITKNSGTELLLIDFRYAQKWKFKNTQTFNKAQKAMYQQCVNKYSSLNLHLGIKPSPHDDIESLMFIIFNFYCKGTFLKCKNKKKLKGRKNKRDGVSQDELSNRKTNSKFTSGTFKLSNVTDIINYEALRQYFKKLLSKVSGSQSILKLYPWQPRKQSMKTANDLKISEESEEEDPNEDEFSSSNSSNDEDKDALTDVIDSDDQSIINVIINLQRNTYEVKELNFKQINQYQYSIN